VGLRLEMAGALEISDLPWRCDGHGKQIPVLQAEAVSRLAGPGQRQAARIVGRMPATEGVLDAQDVDELMLRVHCELDVGRGAGADGVLPADGGSARNALLNVRGGAIAVHARSSTAEYHVITDNDRQFGARSY
jgi:hypothetical protein